MAIATQQTQDERVSELVLQRRMLTPAQLEECKAIQGRGPTPMSLAQVIVAKRYATADDLRALVQAQPGSASGVRPGPTASSSGVTARPTGTFEAAKLDQPSEDADVAFGRFLVQQGIIPIPRTATPDHQGANLAIFDFVLSEAEMAEIGKLKRADGRVVNPPHAPEWDS